MRLKDRVGRLESNLVTLEQDTMSDICKLETQVDKLIAIGLNNKSVPETATCHICGKRDFMDNLADVGWMGGNTEQIFAKCGQDSMFWHSDGIQYAHPSCAHIKRSDDGKGWVRAKK